VIRVDYFLGIDAGTSSIRSMFIDGEGTVAGITRQPIEIELPRPDYAEQSPELWWQTTRSTIRQLTAEHPQISRDVRGIAFAGQMHGLVALAEDFTVLRPAIIWADQRSNAQVDRIRQAFGESALLEAISNRLAAGTLISSLLWVKENEPEVYRRIRRILLPKDYIRYRLTGSIGVEASDASGTFAFDIRRRQWAYPLLEKLGIDASLFPAVHGSAEFAGEITPDAAAQTGLPAGIPVFYGGGDHPVQALGNGVIRAGMVLANIGTASQVSTPVDRPVVDPQHRIYTLCHVLPDRWYLMGASLNGGHSLKWLRDCILQGLDYDAMTREAEQVAPGSGGLIFLPYLLGERTPYFDPQARAIFFGLTLQHHRGHLVRAVMEGTLFALKDALGIFSSLGIETERIIASGGGARSELWLQMQADIFGKTIQRSACPEQACLGAAILAALGAGRFPSVQEACRLVAFDPRIFEPNGRNARIYESNYAIYKDLYRQNQPLFGSS
jgi:xylulokinase